MPDVHVPQVHERGILKLLLEVALISVGVFLGLMGEQWRENRHHRELADDALRRFRTEIVANQKAVGSVKDYHAATLKDVQTYLRAKGDERESARRSVHIKGVQPAFVDRTAWDLALATQSLAYIDSDLAFELSRIYYQQGVLTGLTGTYTQAMYMRPLRENLDAFLESLEAYWIDASQIEAGLFEEYGVVLPKIDHALR
jgi:hypothetical protein